MKNLINMVQKGSTWVAASAVALVSTSAMALPDSATLTATIDAAKTDAMSGLTTAQTALLTVGALMLAFGILYSLIKR